MAGIVDFAFNIGASLAGVLVGTIVDKASWSTVFIVLTIGAVLTSFLFVVFELWVNRLNLNSK